MEPTTTFGFIASGMENSTAELQDFDRVMQLYWPRILRFVMASVRDRDVAETLTQDCFMNAYRARSSFRGESSLNTWLMRIAINNVRKFYRNRKLQFWRKLQNVAVDPTTISRRLADRNISPEARALIHDQVRAVWEATKDLSERQRTVFLLRFMEDMDIVDIAAATGLSRSSVNVHLFRAVRAVRESLRKPK
jgi:RNA polymerase sigma-70 factor (ECF subfamily)